MEAIISLKDVAMEDGNVGVEMTVKMSGEEPKENTFLKDSPTAAFTIAIHQLHSSGDYLDIAAQLLLQLQDTDKDENQ